MPPSVHGQPEGQPSALGERHWREIQGSAGEDSEQTELRSTLHHEGVEKSEHADESAKADKAQPAQTGPTEKGGKREYGNHWKRFPVPGARNRKNADPETKHDGRKADEGANNSGADASKKCLDWV